MANRHPRLVTFRGLLGQSTTIQNSSSLRIGCGTRQAGHIAVSVSVSTTGSSKLICLLRYPLSALVGALTAIRPALPLILSQRAYSPRAINFRGPHGGPA